VVLVVVTITLSIRWSWLPVLLYWLIYSLFSDLRLQFQVVVGTLPITVPDIAVAVIAAMSAFAYFRQSRAQVSRVSAVGIGVASILALSAFSAIVGLAHGYAWYSVAIDLRAIVYLGVGYLAALYLLDARRDSQILKAILWLSVVGFAVEQTLVSFGAFRALERGASFAAYRDISVSFFAGKYGILFALVVFANQRFRTGLPAGVVAGIGVLATVASLIRTAWVGLAAAFLFAAVASGWTRGARQIALVVVILVFGAGVATLSPSASTVWSAAVERGLAAVDPNSLPQQVDTVAGRNFASQMAIAHLTGPLDWLFGVGLGLAVADPLHPYLENSYVWYLSKMGLLGLALLSAAVVALPVLLAMRALPLARGEMKTLLLVLTAAHVGNAVSGYASGHLTNWEYAPLVGMTIAWIVQLARAPQPPNVTDQTAWLDPVGRSRVIKQC
jgi:hypothetical protein